MSSSTIIDQEEENVKLNSSLMDIRTNYEWNFEIEMQQFNIPAPTKLYFKKNL
jgi:hypothetical protein